MISAMPSKGRFRWWLIDRLGRPLIWLWSKSCRLKTFGEDRYRTLRASGRGIVHLVWHRKIFIVPYFFRKRGIMPLVSPSQDGEIAARIMDGWGYKLLRGSGSHFMKDAWLEMKKELESGGEVIIVPDGPRGPDRKLKMGCVKLAAETGAALLPFSFAASRKKVLNSWDRFVIFYPFSRVAAVYGEPIKVPGVLAAQGMEDERQRVEETMLRFEVETDARFVKK
jgi:lysophospholipid acyltransferase (LPLAT)-like uncharacterized protein